MLGSEPIDKVHGGDKTGLGGRAANMREIAIRACGIEGADDTPVECYFGCKVGKVEMS